MVRASGELQLMLQLKYDDVVLLIISRLSPHPENNEWEEFLIKIKGSMDKCIQRLR
jgi:hypothetical protein